MRRWLEGIALAVLVVAQVVLFARLLHTATDYDEGVYLASLRALQHGEGLGNDVFASQPPGFYALLQLVATVFGSSVDDVRFGFACLGAIGVVSAWALARAVVASPAALLAPALLLIAPPLPLFGTRVLADLPSLWLTLAAFAFAAWVTRLRRGTWLAVGAGAFLAAAVSVKLDSLLAVPFVLALLVPRVGAWRLVAWAGAGATGVTAVLLVAHAADLGELWQSAVIYHERARSTHEPLDRWHLIGGIFLVRTPFLWLGAIGLALAAWRAVSRTLTGEELVLWLWTGASFAFLVWHKPLHPNHLVVFPVPAAVAAGVTLAACTNRLGRWQRPVAATLVVIVAAAFVQQARRQDEEPRHEDPALVAAARIMQSSTSPTRLVVSDQPIVTVLAHRQMPGELVDLASLRFETGSLDQRDVLRTIDERCVAAVLVGRALRDEPIVLAGLVRRFARRERIEAGTLYLDLKAQCRAPVPAP